MLKTTRAVIVLCTAAIVMVLLLQFYWIKSYYVVNQSAFEKEVNMAFEDAIKKEFSLRCDTIQHLIANRLLDTTEFKITSEYDTREKQYHYTIANAHHLNEKFSSSSFANKKINRALTPGDTAFKREVAENFAHTFRSEDLENHIVYYRTQNLGGFIINNVNKYDFDTTRLRPVLNHYLAERNIKVPFKFYLRTTDSTLNRSRFNAQLTAKYSIITKSYPTYKQKGQQQYVRVMFTNPFSYIISRMGFMFAGSLLLIGIVAFSLIYLLRQLFNEKRLSVIKNDFISNITHEFKTPIATTSAAIEAMTTFDVLDDREKTRRYLLHSKNELDKLSVLVDKVLNISVYENQQFDIKPEAFNVDDVIKTILKDLSGIQAKSVRWCYSNTTDIVTLSADKAYFQHAISNVIDNAVKYAKNDVLIEVSCAIKNGFFVISIMDNGIGIAQKDLSLVFEKFYRVPTGNHHPIKGHGLGLNYVKSIIEKHQGWYKIESEYGSGSTLTLAWPI